MRMLFSEEELKGLKVECSAFMAIGWSDPDADLHRQRRDPEFELPWAETAQSLAKFVEAAKLDPKRCTYRLSFVPTTEKFVEYWAFSDRQAQIG